MEHQNHNSIKLDGPEKFPVPFARNVLLTVEEAQKLAILLQPNEIRYWCIELDRYLRKDPANLDKFKSHYLTILNWRRRQQKNPRIQKDFETPKDIY